MNLGHKLQNGNSKFTNHAILKNLNKNLAHQVYERSGLSQTYLFKEQPSNKILKTLPISETENLSYSFDLIYLNKHQNIYQPDDPINYLYFPESAVISEYQILEDGKTVEVAMTGPEGVIGITSVFDSQPSVNWSQVLIPGKVLRISADFFRQKLDCCEAFQKRIFEFINAYISQISQRAVCNNHHTVEERLCSWLLMISDRCERSTLPLTQEQISRFLGVHRPSVTLVTQSLRDKGVIDYVRGNISITDAQKLKNLSCICYAAAEKKQKKLEL